MIEGDRFAFEDTVKPSRPKRLWGAEIVLNLCVRGDRKVRVKVASQDGFARVLWEVVLDAVAAEDMQREAVSSEAV